MPSTVKAHNGLIICRQVVESKCLNVKINVKSNSVFITRVQVMALVNCRGADLEFERIKGYGL